MRSRSLHAGGSIALVVLVLVGSTVAVGLVALTADRAAGQPTAGSATLGDSVVGVSQGATTTLEVRLDGTRNATLVLGGEETGYNITITVTDLNGDGTVPLEFRTGPVGMDATRFRPADDADEYATLNATPNPDGMIPVADYPIAVYAGHGVTGEPTDIGTLAVTEPMPAPSASIEHDGSAVTLHPQSEQVVSGTVDLEAGRNVSVRLRASGSSPFLQSEEVSVRDDSRFTARFDLSGIDAPANATATVYVGGQQVAGPTDVVIVEERTPTDRQITTEQETQTPGQPGFGLLIATIAVVVAGALRRFVRA